MTDPINSFAKRLNSKVIFSSQILLEKEGRCYLLEKELERVTKDDFFYAGWYLGKMKKKRFFPSFILLKILSETEANRVVVDDKAAWLFICGRDIFGDRIIAKHGSIKKGDYTLVLNSLGECLGFGRIVRNLDEAGDIAVKNVSDVGDFLRREK